MKRRALALSVMIAGCETVTAPSAMTILGPRRATDAEVALAVSAYANVATCLGLPDASARVNWYVANDLFVRGEPMGGHMKRDTIWVARYYADNFKVWRHESMHHVLWRARGDSDVDHDNPKWATCAAY